jgi:hypothetical protein
MASYELICVQEANKPGMDRTMQNFPIFVFIAKQVDQPDKLALI